MHLGTSSIVGNIFKGVQKVLPFLLLDGGHRHVRLDSENITLYLRFQLVRGCSGNKEKSDSRKISQVNEAGLIPPL